MAIVGMSALLRVDMPTGQDVEHGCRKIITLSSSLHRGATLMPEHQANVAGARFRTVRHSGAAIVGTGMTVCIATRTLGQAIEDRKPDGEPGFS